MQYGLTGPALEGALESVCESVSTTLGDEVAGRWILANSHPGARSEWELVISEGQKERRIIIDRSFVDEASGVRWIIDYKNSSPLADEGREAFLRRETEHYAEQLRQYRDAVKELTDDPIQCGLYFTAEGCLHVLE